MRRIGCLEIIIISSKFRQNEVGILGAESDLCAYSTGVEKYEWSNLVLGNYIVIISKKTSKLVSILWKKDQQTLNLNRGGLRRMTS